jgi:hypothetical protein
MTGKGSKPRPIKDREKFEANWKKIFGDKPKKTPPKKPTNGS